MGVIEHRILQLIDHAIDRNTTVIELKKDVAELKKDVAELKKDVAELKKDVAELKMEFLVLKNDVRIIYDLVMHNTALFEESRRDMRLILDVIMPIRKGTEAIEDLNKSIDGHEIRITAVEHVVKDHVQSHKSQSR